MSDGPEDPAARETAHPGGTRWTLLAVVLLMAVALGVAAYRLVPVINPPIPDRELSESEKESVFDCMRSPLLHENAARECVETFGWQALPFYHAVIQDSDEQEWVRGNACLLAGIYQDDKTAAHIISLVEELAESSVSKESLSAIATALDGLGFSGSQAAYAFLADDAMEPEHWLGKTRPPFREEDETPNRFIEILQKRAVRALGLMPGGLGIDALETIRGEKPALAMHCDAAIEDARSRRWGLKRLGDVASH